MGREEGLTIYDYEKSAEELEMLEGVIKDARQRMKHIMLKFKENNSSDIINMAYYSGLMCDILEETTGVGLKEIREKCREAKHVNARKWAAAIMRENGLGPSEIGRWMKRDHATIINLFKKHEFDMDMYARYRKGFNEFKKRLEL